MKQKLWLLIALSPLSVFEGGKLIADTASPDNNSSIITYLKKYLTNTSADMKEAVDEHAAQSPAMAHSIDTITTHLSAGQIQDFLKTLDSGALHSLLDGIVGSQQALIEKVKLVVEEQYGKQIANFVGALISSLSPQQVETLFSELATGKTEAALRAFLDIYQKNKKKILASLPAGLDPKTLESFLKSTSPAKLQPLVTSMENAFIAKEQAALISRTQKTAKDSVAAKKVATSLGQKVLSRRLKTVLGTTEGANFITDYLMELRGQFDAISKLENPRSYLVDQAETLALSFLKRFEAQLAKAANEKELTKRERELYKKELQRSLSRSLLKMYVAYEADQKKPDRSIETVDLDQDINIQTLLKDKSQQNTARQYLNINKYLAIAALSDPVDYPDITSLKNGIDDWAYRIAERFVNEFKSFWADSLTQDQLEQKNSRIRDALYKDAVEELNMEFERQISGEIPIRAIAQQAPDRGDTAFGQMMPPPPPPMPSKKKNGVVPPPPPPMPKSAPKAQPDRTAKDESGVISMSALSKAQGKLKKAKDRSAQKAQSAPSMQDSLAAQMAKRRGSLGEDGKQESSNESWDD